MIRPVHTPIGRASTACIVFSFLVLFTPDATPAPTPLGQPIQTIRSEVKAEEAMNFMRQVYSTDRWFTFPKFHETAEYVKQSMKELVWKRSSCRERQRTVQASAGSGPWH